MVVGLASEVDRCVDAPVGFFCCLLLKLITCFSDKIFDVS